MAEGDLFVIGFIVNILAKILGFTIVIHLMVKRSFMGV